MTVWGIGGIWFLWTFIGSLPVIICAYLFRYSLIVTSISPWWFYSIGVLLLIGGIPFWLLSAITLKKAFDKEHLCTSGVFGVCRNPYLCFMDSISCTRSASVFSQSPANGNTFYYVIQYCEFCFIKRKNGWKQNTVKVIENINRG